MVDFDVGVILPTAGSSERFGSSRPKQYTEILGKPLFLYALEEFISIKYVKKIAVVVDDVENAKSVVQEKSLSGLQKVVFVRGERTRHRSIKAGLQELHKYHKEKELTVVVIHDGVRPLVPVNLVEELVLSALSIGASGPVRPLVSTVLKGSANSTLETSLNRNAYCASETPQAFRFEVIFSAYNKCDDYELDYGTECLQLVLDHCGIRAKLIPGPADLWKVTYKKDLYTAISCLREKSTDICIISETQTEAVVSLGNALADKAVTVKTVLGTSLMKGEESESTFNTVIFFHINEIHEDQHLLNFATLLNLDKQGLIIHVIDHASVDEFQSMSVYNLHRNSCKMAHNYEKLKKGVVVIHCVSSNELQKLVDIVVSLIQLDPLIFSGQTLFL